ncbi:MAG TPA: ABC transporter ATP-binding protein [Clostridiales bacterium]|nr:ABC transporter ATP-binding protein [Clostridiales bacterium]
MMNALLESHNVSKVYPSGPIRVTAVRDVSLSIAEGEAVGLMGPSGSGKTTLLKLLGLLSRATRGSVFVRGEEVGGSEHRRARLRNQFFGYVHQDFAIIENETVERNVLIPLEYARPRPAWRECRSRTQMVLDQVGIGWARKRNPSKLSMGERQRVAIARALVNNPVVVLADEPTAALDGVTAEEVMTLILSIKDRGASVLIATHDDRVARRCDRIVRIVDGSLVTGGDSPQGRAVLTPVGANRRAVGVSFPGDGTFRVDLADGCALVVPFTWARRLGQATTEQQVNVRIVGDGRILSWPEVGEDIDVLALLEGDKKEAM